MYYPIFTKAIIHHFMSKDPLIPRRNKFGALLPIEPTDDEIRNSKAYKEYYAIATGEAAPKPKASVRRTKSSSDTSITPLTAATSPRIKASAKGKQTTKASKAKSLSALSEDDDGDEEDEGDDGEEENGDDDEEDDVGKEEESFDPIPQTPESNEDEGDGEKDQGLNIGEEERHDEEEEEDELYRDVNINQGRGLPASLEVKDSHVTLTLVKPDVSAIPGIVQHYMDQRMNEAVKVAVQIELYRLREEAQRENDEFLRIVDENIKKIIKEQVKEQVKAQVSKILPRIEQAVNEQLKAKALVDAYKSDKIILDTYGEIVTLKRRHDHDEDKDEEPSAGPDRGSKRRREGKESESASASTETATRSAGRSTKGSRSRQASPHQPPTPDRDWNKTLPAIHESIQPWISELVKQADTRSSFNELMDTPLDFSNFIMNRLRVDTLTPKLLAGPTYDLPLSLIPDNRGRRVIPFAHFINNDLEYLRGGASSRKYTTSVTKTKAADYRHIKWIEDLVPRTMWIQEPIDYDKHALWGRRIIAVTELKIVEWHSCKHLEWITVIRDDDKLYKFKEGDYKRLRIQDIEDMLLLLRRVEDLQLGVKSYQKRLNLTKPDTYWSDLKHNEAYTAYSNLRGFIYQNKDKKNRLMRIDELHKFSDGTLTDVRTALDDPLKGIRMRYLPQTI
nr:hypothetical protein [Tanacetum cinerariifolium]